MLQAADVEASWYGRPHHLGRLSVVLLRVLSQVYGAIIRLRAFLYRVGVLRSTRLPVPVIVVGNLIVGGAGKTPVTRTLASALRDMGWHPGIVSRGYGRKQPGVREVESGASPEAVGDEPLLYVQDGFPVFVGERRADAGRALLAAYPEVDILLADDGLQHLALARDLELVVFDGRGLGNGRLLPAGPLREPVARLRHQRVAALLVQGKPWMPVGHMPPCYHFDLVPVCFYRLWRPGEVVSLQSLAGQSITAIAGIGHPEKFFDMLRRMGLQVEGHRFPDHHDFTLADMPETTGWLLMTEKDAVKCREFATGHDKWLVVPVTAVFSPALPLADWLGARKLSPRNLSTL